jgi:HAD superfamily hydrolase (TIGR01490 family)
MTETNRAAFFDLDRTFIDCNSGLLYARWEFRRGTISLWTMLRVLIWGIGYHFSLINIEKAYREALTLYRHKPESEVRQWTKTWFNEMVEHRAQPGALATLAAHKEAGDPCVLLTNSSCYAAECATAEWGFDAWIANEFSTDDEGLLDGDFHEPLCYGSGKVTYAERWAAKEEVSLDDSVFYSDSLSDLPMLERVGHPVVVNPDPRLRAVASRRGWRVEDWKAARLASTATSTINSANARRSSGE